MTFGLAVRIVTSKGGECGNPHVEVRKGKEVRVQIKDVRVKIKEKRRIPCLELSHGGDSTRT